MVFGGDPATTVKRLRPVRLVNFSDARFDVVTNFQKAVFNHVPAFFDCCLYEDTDFSFTDRTLVNMVHGPIRHQP